MKVKGIRNPNATHIAQQLNNAEEDEQTYEVASIQGERVVQGKVQYLIEWKGYTEMTWVNEKSLNCHELMEDWELENDN